MADGASDLSEREREILRLLARGYDVKSGAAALDISVHSANERLRGARRKLGVTSSREAARMLVNSEGRDHEFSVAKKNGLPPTPVKAPNDPPAPAARAGSTNWALALAGGIIMLALIGLAAIAWLKADDPPARAGGIIRSEAPIVTLPVPQAVSTNPRPGAVVAPGPFDLSVTFDQPMRDQSYSFVQVSPDTFPECASRPAVSADRKTFTLRCTARAGRRYELWFTRAPFMNFKSQAGVPARPLRLRFRSSAK